MGGGLLISPFIADRIEHVSLGPSGVDLWLITQVSDRGAPRTAQILQRTELGRFAESYALVHVELRGDKYRAARVHLQDLLVSRASATATREKFEAREVRALFADGSPVVRVLVLGLMQGDASLADANTITAAITDGRSGNEQYQSLRLANLCWTRLKRADRQEICQAIEQARFEPESARRREAQEILALPLD
ncbi:MAG TPA: hypothetical protein VMA73_21415 [Streptosporangiaceae bacterium]|nr:hypothetical protein [Streptosporangiaceae bacterium]